MARRSEMAGHFKTAIGILDATEPQIRDIIEGGLMHVTEANMTKKNAVEEAVQNVLAQISAVRLRAIKQSFRHLRANLDHV